MDSQLVYSEHAPTPAIADTVACYWQLVGNAPATDSPHCVLPDGCLDLLFNLGDPWSGHERALVTGPICTPLEVKLAARTTLVGVRFRPGGLGYLIPEGASQAANTAVDDIWPELGSLAEQLAALPDLPRRAALLDRILSDRCRHYPGAELVAEAVRVLQGGAPPRVRGLAPTLGVSRQYLARVFQRAVGHTPSELSRIIRFRRSLALLDNPGLPLCQVAVGAGYADQPHMNREFRQLAGTTPHAWRFPIVQDS